MYFPPTHTDEILDENEMLPLNERNVRENDVMFKRKLNSLK